ncbi:MAG TPA: GGDEF domain-containing phosphodiesterase, partial [Geobacteraceae bacterium]|nr:GGDEF domain-containing phosphodiesterase [Geobacteraceae bacterium]
YPEDGETMEALFKNADIAMYSAKEQGGNSYRFYNPKMNIRLIERMRLESLLRQVLDRAELDVYYQPQLTIDTRQVICAEALVRWRHPELGMLDPVRFIPFAEEIGFITAVDEWVLKTACAQCKEWHNAGLPHLCVAVNLSAKQLQKADFVERIAGILRETGFDPHHLEVEITESVAMRNLEQTIPNMILLTEMGVSISVDNFGTGYSSLNYLKKLPIHKLKIDKSFLQDLATNSDNRAIISAATALAQNMKLKVIAVGVETEEQLEFLKSTGCQEMQGFLFSRPLPAEEFRELIALKKGCGLRRLASLGRPRGVEGGANGLRQHFGAIRLRKERRSGNRLGGGTAAGEDDPCARVDLPDRAKDLHPGPLGHREVEHHQVDRLPVRPEKIDRPHAVLGQEHRVPVHFHHLAAKVADQFLVVREQHRLPPPPGRRGLR